MSVIRSNFFH